MAGPLAEHVFLESLRGDEYYPAHLLDKGRDIFVRLCARLDAEPPADLAGLYVLTHAATEEFNELQEEFWDADSEIETVAREAIAEDMETVATAYGFAEADLEELVAPRDW
ncbi:hypothetical protein Afil01_54450 [Actinorhabdospora filicis]|uniref:Uncharacterized protein n=1 Tax=Actinorhabdospora filicis TaxID=1785913 RepID=A0A9W6SRA4_9ACTN|nr:DUF5713 family protein [Actinorhabdospora filicis]GLZ80638.1 hypothetical protein Afil01_54450 [Actinorhabdospora filicis]